MKNQVKQNMNALKRHRSDVKKCAANKFRMHTMKTLIKKAKAAHTTDSVSIAQRYVDMNVKLGLVHKNKAARLKSAMYGKLA